MSSFSSLQTQRKSKQSKSFTTSGAPTAVEKAAGALTISGDVAENADGSVIDQLVSGSDQLYQCLPASLDVRTTSEDGRGIWAKKGFAAGDIIFITKPHVHVLSSRNLDSLCSSCSSPGTNNLRRCTRCRVVWYCDSQCQNNDWQTHKKECEALKRWADGAPTPDVAIPAEPIRCLGRLLWSKQKHKSGSVWAREIDSMQSHRTSLPPEAAEGHTHLAHATIRYLGLNAPGELGAFGIQTAAEIVDVISRVGRCSLYLWF